MASPTPPIASAPVEKDYRGSRNTLIVTNDDGTDLVVKLTIMDKLLRILFSKQEWEARLLEKIANKKLAYNQTCKR